MDVPVSSLELYEKYALRVYISAKLKTLGILPDMASEVDLLQSSRADVCFGVLLHTIACADRHPICLYRLEQAWSIRGSEPSVCMERSKPISASIRRSLNLSVAFCYVRRYASPLADLKTKLQYLSDVTSLTATKSFSSDPLLSPTLIWLKQCWRSARMRSIRMARATSRKRTLPLEGDGFQ